MKAPQLRFGTKKANTNILSTGSTLTLNHWITKRILTPIKFKYELFKKSY